MLMGRLLMHIVAASHLCIRQPQASAEGSRCLFPFMSIEDEFRLRTVFIVTIAIFFLFTRICIYCKFSLGFT